jgi:hypothetical protein
MQRMMPGRSLSLKIPDPTLTSKTIGITMALIVPILMSPYIMVDIRRFPLGHMWL